MVLEFVQRGPGTPPPISLSKYTPPFPYLNTAVYPRFIVNLRQIGKGVPELGSEIQKEITTLY